MRNIRWRRGPGWFRSDGKSKIVFVLAAAVLSLLGVSEWVLSGVAPELIEEAARGCVLECVTQAVEEELEEEPGPFVTVQRNQDGQVEMAAADPERLNRLKAGVLERLAGKLKNSATIHIPAGSLTGIGLLNGRGFPVPLKLRLESSATVEFATEFTGAGLNQTCHRLTMTVDVRAYSASRRFEASVEAQTSTVLAETMIVGEVPAMWPAATEKG